MKKKKIKIAGLIGGTITIGLVIAGIYAYKVFKELRDINLNIEELFE